MKEHVIKQRMPGFNAEATFHKESKQYRNRPDSTGSARNNSAVVPSLSRSRVCQAMIDGCIWDNSDWCCERIVRYCF